MNIWSAFEIPTPEDRQNLPQADVLDSLHINESELGLDPTTFCIAHPKLSELIREYNNKVGDLIITYTLAYHYFRASIPDERWYQSPGNNGQSVQYMPDFSDEHWGRNMWFGYFANVYYILISSLWDSIIEVINHYYDYDFPVDLRLRNAVLKKLKADHPNISALFLSIQNDELYKKAQEYRTAASHGSSSNSVKNTIRYEKDILSTFPVFDDSGMPVLDSDGNPKVKQVKTRKISFGIGKYTPASAIFQNMQAYAQLSTVKIHEILSLMIDEH